MSRLLVRFFAVGVLAVALILSAFPGDARASNHHDMHVVQPGETLFRIAQRYGTTWPRLAELNNLSNPRHIYVGQRLRLNEAAAPGSTSTGGIYVVQRGDTLSRIATQHGVTLSALVQANNIANPSHIYTGQRLTIPGPGAAPQAPTAPTSQGKVILVSIGQQHLWAYENGNLVLNTPVTTGRPGADTPVGTFEVQRKYSPYLFRSPYPRGHRFYYDPLWSSYSLRFTWRGHHIHDSPWRSHYGPGTNLQGSIGCVNVPPSVMPDLYAWTTTGTPIVIRG